MRNCLISVGLMWVLVLGSSAVAQSPAPKPAASDSKKSAPLLPSQDFLISLRQVDARQAGYSVSTQATPPMQAYTLRISNGGQGTLRLSQAMPMLWMSGVSSQNAQLNASGTVQNTGASVSASSSGGSVSQSLVWMEAGQSLVFAPQWAGGEQAVRLEVSMAAQSVDVRQGLDLPSQQAQQLSTSVSVPLGQWVTLSDSGERTTPGVLSTNTAQASRRWVQVRVSLP